MDYKEREMASMKTKCIKKIFTLLTILSISISVSFLSPMQVFADGYSIQNTMSDTEAWQISGINQSGDVVLLPNAMGFNDAEITYDKEKVKGFNVVHLSEDLPISNSNQPQCQALAWWPTDEDMKDREKGKNRVLDNEYTLKDLGMKLTFPEAAIHLKSGEGGTSFDRYDVVMTIKSMKIKIKGAMRYSDGIPTLYGCDTWLNFGSFGFGVKPGKGEADKRPTVGVKYHVHVTLEKSDNSKKTIDNSASMLWGFSDIDVGDKFDDNKPYIENNKNHEWAEHATLYKKSENKDMMVSTGGKYVIYTSESTALVYTTSESATAETITFYKKTTDKTIDDQTGTFAALVRPSGFRFTWQGSGCATRFAPVAGTTYTGTSLVYYRGADEDYVALTDDEKNLKNISKRKGSQLLTVRDNNAWILFRHKITRDGNGPETDAESYYVKAAEDADVDSRPNKGSADARLVEAFKKNQTKTIYGATRTVKDADGNEKTERIIDTETYNGTTYQNPKKVKLAPGQVKVLRQTLYYRLSNMSEVLGNYTDVTCKKNSSEITDIFGEDKYASVGVTKNYPGSVCATLFRPEAKFKGKVTAKVVSGGGNSTSAGVEITDPNGNFKVDFTASIIRAKAGTDADQDQAGGTATAHWYVQQYLKDNGKNVWMSDTRIPKASDSPNYNLMTKGITNGQKVFLIGGDSEEGAVTYTNFANEDYSYSGTLARGEVRQVCTQLKYNSIVNKTKGNVTSSATKCVKVWRAALPCAIAADNKFSVENGENLGRIGVNNRTLSGDDNYSYTQVAASSFKSENNYTVSTSIWARPGDSIRFIHEGCAGAAYSVKNNSTLDDNTYKSVYTAKGSLSNSNSKGYLFGDTIPTRDPSDSSLYNATRNWDSTTAAENTFMSGSEENAQMSEYSPSEATGADDSYNSSTYSCYNPSSTFTDNHYQIAGLGMAADDIAANCNSYAKTAVSIDVGHTITQSLSWNHLKITNGSANSEYANNDTFTAKANVKVPYNYIIHPTVAADIGDQKVLYLGGKAKFDVSIMVQPRLNTVVSDTEYATITKPTKVEAEIYVVDSDGNKKPLKEVTLNERFNTNSDHNGGNTEIFKGESVTINDDIKVGDRICASVEVTPVDSHDAPNATSVEGAGDDNIALSENGISTYGTRKACYSVAKRPTMSVEGSNAYAGGDNGFQTSRYGKQFSVSSPSYTFGSWAEYGVYGKVDIRGGRGFASGATFGYATENSGVSINAPRNNDEKTARYLDGTTGENICVFSTQTFANADCNSATESIGTVGIGKSAAKKYRDEIVKYFDASEKDVEDIAATEDGGIGQYVKIEKNSSGELHGGVEYFYSKNTTILKGLANNDDYPANIKTRVVQVTGDTGDKPKLIITDDIISNNRTGTTYQKIGDIAQTIIIADEVEITANVEDIEAIIVANKVNTCAYANENGALSGVMYEIGGDGSDPKYISSDVCNKQLVFHAPVLTKEITLNRTYGAGSGTNSVKRAEIFDFDPYTQLWSSNQMKDFGQANTVYSKQLPPRF